MNGKIKLLPSVFAIGVVATILVVVTSADHLSSSYRTQPLSLFSEDVLAKAAANDPLALLQVDTPPGSGQFRPLDFSIVPTTTPTVRISLPEIPNHVQVLLDDTDPSTPVEDITSAFASGLLSVGEAQASVPVAIDNNTVQLVALINGDELFASASMLNFGVDISVVSSNITFPPTSTPVETDQGMEDLEFEDDVILLSFDMEAPLEAVSPTSTDAINTVLRQEQLVPLAFGVPVHLVRAQITTGENPYDMAQRLAASSIPILDAVLPNVLAEDRDVAGEAMPARLTNAYRASGGARCQRGAGLHGCFDYDGPDATNELRVFRYHFFMDSFAGHRLVERIVGPSAGQQAGLATIDRGLGNYGADPCAGNPAFNTVADIPCNALFRISSAPFNFDADGVQVDAAGAPRALNLTDIRDVAYHHGTHVNAAAAGRGNGLLAAPAGEGKGILGTGRHVRVRPFKRGAWDQSVYAILGAILDPDVDVINTSWGATGAARRDSFTAAGIQGLIVNVVDLARASGKIWVAAGANDGADSGGTSFPDDFAPRRDGGRTRTAATPLVMKICSTETAGTVDGQRVRGPEQLSDFSSFGNRQSATAPGGDVMLPHRTTGVLERDDGCSFAAPVVAGLAAEMIYLDKNFFPSLPPTFTPLQIIEIIEATADDLGTTEKAVNTPRPNDSPGNGRDNFFGHGRINVWKALLSVANEALASASHDIGPTGFSPAFPILVQMTAADT
ncbi:MAG: hypothetical protein E3J25_03285, partial [Anaerolineales bacterium]